MKRKRKYRRMAALVLIAGMSLSGRLTDETDYAKQRERMVSRQLEARGISDPRVLGAMRAVPRHLFVPPSVRHLAYADHALPLEDGQTISQPYIVALMTQALAVRPEDKVLEIGTGSGYQAAVLACLTERVFSVEIIRSLADKARASLHRLGYDRVRVRWSDGRSGWREEAPFDAVIVTCASPELPEDLFKQVREGGRIILPLGDPNTHQVLTLVTKVEGVPRFDAILDVRFVPMTKRKRTPAWL